MTEEKETSGTSSSSSSGSWRGLDGLPLAAGAGAEALVVGRRGALVAGGTAAEAGAAGSPGAVMFGAFAGVAPQGGRGGRSITCAACRRGLARSAASDEKQDSALVTPPVPTRVSARRWWMERLWNHWHEEHHTRPGLRCFIAPRCGGRHTGPGPR